MKAKDFLWGAFPASNLRTNGNNRKLWVGPIPRGTEIPEDCVFYDADRQKVLDWIDAPPPPKRKKGADRKTRELFR